jgi:ribosome-interacting GTPase 1
MLIALQCNAIHKTIVEQFKGAMVYGKSVKHQPQRVGLSHELADEDISECPTVPRLERRKANLAQLLS